MADVFLDQYLQIVDSVIALFRVDFTGRGELADRQVYHMFSEMHITNYVDLMIVTSVLNLR